MRGVEICEPCKHLDDVTGTNQLLSALIHRGGLHAQILTDGEIRTNDRVQPEGDE